MVVKLAVSLTREIKPLSVKVSIGHALQLGNGPVHQPPHFRVHVRQGGEVAGIARKALEARTGKPVITEKNAVDFQQLVTDIVEDAAELPENPTEKKDKD